MSQRQKKRSIFLINKPFQLRFSFYVCSWLFVLSLVLPLVIFSLFDFFNRFARTNAPGRSLAFLGEIQSDILWNIGLFELSFAGVTFLISLFVSHRIAGPLYKLKMYMDKSSDGKLAGNLTFRKGDYFQDIADSYNALVSKVQENCHGSSKEIQQSIQDMENLANRLDGTTKKELQQALDGLKRAHEKLSV